MDDKQLRTIWHQRQPQDYMAPIGQSLAMLLKQQLAKRVRQLSKLAGVWDAVIPAAIAEHTALESLHQGVLTVKVDTAAHRFQLENLLRGGLLTQLRTEAGIPLQRVKVIPGQFYSIDVCGNQRYDL